MKKIIATQLLILCMNVALCSEDADKDSIVAKIAQAEAMAIAEVEAKAAAEKIAEIERVVAVEIANQVTYVAEMTSVGDHSTTY